MSDFITLRVGKDGKKYNVAERHACVWSPVLQAAIDNWENPTRIFSFDNVMERTICLLQQWLINQELIISQFDQPACMNQENRAFIELWNLAATLEIPRLQNSLISKIDEIQEQTNKMPFENMSYVYENTGPESPLRGFFVRMFVTQLHPDNFKIHADSFPPEMVLDMVTLFSKTLNELDEKTSWGGIDDFFVAED